MPKWSKNESNMRSKREGPKEYSGRRQRHDDSNEPYIPQQRRSSAEEAEARREAARAAREAEKERAADQWFREKVLAFRTPSRFVDVVLTKEVSEVVKDGDRLKTVKHTERTVESVIAKSDEEALILAFRRQPSFQKAYVAAER